jgi:hypothetical protein
MDEDFRYASNPFFDPARDLFADAVRLRDSHCFSIQVQCYAHDHF